MQSHLKKLAPGQWSASAASTQAPQKSRRTHWSRRRNVAVALMLLIVCAPLAMVGWYVWDITSAIDEAQDVAVVALPEGSRDQQSESFGTPQSDQPGNASNIDPSSMDVARGIISAGTHGEDTSPEKVWPGQRYLNILVIGVDTRPDGGEQNADVIIIARLDLKSKSMNSVTIPRDLLVEIPGHGEGKINSAYGIGLEEDPGSRIAGVAKVRDTIEHNFDVSIDDYVMIDFEGFREVVDAVGGIDINVPTRIVDEAYPTEDYGIRTLIIEAGLQHMDGETALSYARTRHADSDDQRRERQMLVIQALFDKGQQVGTVTRAADLIAALSGATQTSFHWEQQLALAALALEMDESRIRMWNIKQPLIQSGTTANGAWVYVGDRDAITAFIESALSGKEPVTVDASAPGT